MPDATSHLTLGQTELYLGIAVALIPICAFFAASETSLLSVRDSRISQLIQEGDPRAAIVGRLRERPERMLVSIQIIITLVTTLASALATAVCVDLVPVAWGKGIAIAIATILVLFFLSLFGEIAPKNWALGHSESFALRAGRVVHWVCRVGVFPLAWLLEALAAGIIRLLGGQKPSNMSFPTEEEIKHIVEQGAQYGELEEEEKEMIHKVMEIPGIMAREIMTPRTQIVGAEIGTPLSEVVALVVNEGHTRLPVYENSLDNIRGIIHSKDLLILYKDGEAGISLETLMRPPLNIPETKKVDKLLQEFKQTKQQMAVVLDEYGGTVGIVTMEDVLEEIVGPIEDEYDEPEEKDIQIVRPGEYRIVGSASLEDVCEAIALEVQPEDSEGYDTVSGLVFGLLGRVPAVGDAIDYNGWKLAVEKVSSRRVDLLLVTRLDKVDPVPADGQGRGGSS